MDTRHSGLCFTNATSPVAEEFSGEIGRVLVLSMEAQTAQKQWKIPRNAIHTTVQVTVPMLQISI